MSLYVPTDPITISASYLLGIIFINFISYVYVIVKFFKILCYSKLTFEWLPLLNPYEWPFCIFYEVTQPYFKFWAKLIPPIKFEDSSFEISAIISLEVLNAFLYFCVRLVNTLAIFLQTIEDNFPIRNYLKM